MQPKYILDKAGELLVPRLGPDNCMILPTMMVEDII